MAELYIGEHCGRISWELLYTDSEVFKQCSNMLLLTTHSAAGG